mgnify:CR=1 FL=1|jgi:hypothetical protein
MRLSNISSLGISRNQHPKNKSNADSDEPIIKIEEFNQVEAKVLVFSFAKGQND